MPLALSGCCGMGWAAGRKGSVWLRSAEAGTPGLPGAGKASHGPCGGLCVRTAPASFRGARGAAAARAGAAPGGSAGLGPRIAPHCPALPRPGTPAPPRPERAAPGQERRGAEPPGRARQRPRPLPHSPGWGRWLGRRGRPWGSRGCRAAP